MEPECRGHGLLQKQLYKTGTSQLSLPAVEDQAADSANIVDSPTQDQLSPAQLKQQEIYIHEGAEKATNSKFYIQSI